MRRILTTTTVMALALLVSATAQAAEKKAKDGKAIDLFKSLGDWDYVSRDKDSKMADVWSIKDGLVSCAGKPVGYIRTKESYKNYKLTLEWRFDPEKGPGNSGVLLRMVGEDKVWPKSIEAQLHSTNAGDFWNIGNFQMTVDEKRTKGRNTKKLHPTNEKKLGEWNQYEITVDGGNVVLKVNGLVQNEATDCAEVAGKICLQSEGAFIQFRNLLLTPLGK